MTGFECTAFPQIGMDELALTQHDRFWGSDLLLAARAGCTTIRYGIRWHVVNPTPREWDWTSVDGPMQLMRDLGIEPIVDLFHFGVPTWLDEGVMTPIFPDFQAELPRRVARRHGGARRGRRAPLPVGALVHAHERAVHHELVRRRVRGLVPVPTGPAQLRDRG